MPATRYGLSEKKTPRAGKQRRPAAAQGLGARAANSLYRLDATADGAAGRPEAQEGQAGRSAPSGLATGTENRREMNSVKTGRDREVKVAGGWGRGARGGREGVGKREPFRVTPTLGNQKAGKSGG